MSTSLASSDTQSVASGKDHFSVHLWMDPEGKLQATTTSMAEPGWIKVTDNSDVAALAKRLNQQTPSLEFYVGEGGTLPTRGSDGAAGFDLYASEDKLISHVEYTDSTGKIVGTKELVNTGLRWRGIPGYALIIKDRSGVAWKGGAETAAGVIDSDYRGEIKVLLRNHNASTVFEVKKGDRIAQCLLVPVATPAVKSITLEELDSTVRGEGGFGSTGK